MTAELPNELTVLFRSVGSAELQLIRKAGGRRFPERLPSQPVFYPVTNRAYAAQIARDWNARKNDDRRGYVTRFLVRTAFLQEFDRKTVGGAEHEEYWIPADRLGEFNDAVVGLIEVVDEFDGGEPVASGKAPSADGIEIRSATRDDLGSIVSLLADDPLGKQRERAESPLPQSYLDAFDEMQSDPRTDLLVADADGEVVGTATLTILPYLTYQGGRRAQIEAVRVAEWRRRDGLGERLVRHACARAHDAGCHLVQLTTDRQRPDAVRFYEKIGFEATHFGLKLHLK